MHPMLNIAVKAARRAGQIINRGALDLEGVHVSAKQSHDYVTEIDQAAEAAIIEILQTSFPHHGILAEESGQARSESEYQWVIDPLDGTTNFIHGFPQYAISIALRHKGILTQAVVFDPNRNELFTASRGKGAFLNERRIRVSNRSNFGECLIGTGFPFRAFDRIDHYLVILKELTRLVSGIRRPGAAALDLAWVACGRIDGFWEYGLSPWDMAAGALLISEAGGLVGDWQGEQNHLEKGEVVAANPKIFAHLLRVFTQAERISEASMSVNKKAASKK